jgi:hypothetical protein
MKFSKIINEIIEDRLKEMPLKSITPVGFGVDSKTGKMKSHSFSDKRDRELITNPVNIQKLKNFFSKTDGNFNFWFINKKGARKFAELGEVRSDFIEKEFGINMEKLPNYDDEDINVFFVGNTAAEKVPMTSWTIAHRFGHAIRKSDAFEYFTSHLEQQFDRLVSEYYGVRKKSKFDNDFEKYKAKFFNKIGTMRSARENKIKRYFEFYYELFAQYLNSGKVTFNNIGNEEIDEDLSTLSNDVEILGDDVLNSLYGKTFVM